MLHSAEVPTKRRRHAITETPPVEEALSRLRRETGSDRLDLGELVILGAGEKLARIRAERARSAEALRWLAERIRSGESLADSDAADEVRRTGWARG